MQDFESALREALPRGVKGRQDTITGAEWAGIEDLGSEEWVYDQARLFLGYRGGRTVGWRDDRHVLTVAGSRAGKGVSLIIPNLLLYHGSVLAIDPKGELAAITCRARCQMGSAASCSIRSGRTSVTAPPRSIPWTNSMFIRR